MNPHFIDVHCHVQFDAYGHDRDEIIEGMHTRGVTGIVVGCDQRSSEEAVRVADQYAHLHATVGVHPNHTDDLFDYEQLRSLAAHPKVVAIGECGLDYFRPTHLDQETKDKQKKLFLEHVRLAKDLDLPLIIHTRPSKGTTDAYQDLISLLTEEKKENPSLRGDVHFFVGNTEQATLLISLGFMLSFTAVITFTHDYDEVIRTVPLQNILSETDAPYVAPASRRGERNDPLSVIEVVERIATLRGQDQEIVRMALLENAQRLFSL